MKRIISFEKKLEFPSMVGEITSISLEHTLNFISPSTIEGFFLVTGTYKLTEASCIEENFNFKIPTEIMLNEKIDVSTSKIEIDDFYYEIENEENLICYIDVLVEGVEEIEIVEEIKEIAAEPTLTSQLENTVDEVLSRECDGDLYQDEQEQNIIPIPQEQIPIEEAKEEKEIEQMPESKEENEKENKTEPKKVESLFSSLRDDDDTFATYSIYIVRQDETLQTIIEKYKTTKEELEDYNDLSNITIGSKIIIPLHDK